MMRGLRMLLPLWSSQLLTFCWTLVSILIVSSCPSWSLSVSHPASLITTSLSSSKQSRQPIHRVDQEHPEVTAFPSSLSKSKSSTSSLSVLIPTSILSSNQFPSMLSSFNFLRTKNPTWKDKSIIINSKNLEKKIKSDDTNTETSDIKINKAEGFSESDIRINDSFELHVPGAASSSLSERESRSTAVFIENSAIDKSDNQISSHQPKDTTAPFPGARTNRNEKKVAEPFTVESGQNNISSRSESTNSPKFSLLNRPKRHLRQQILVTASLNSTPAFLKHGNDHENKQVETFLGTGVEKRAHLDRAVVGDPKPGLVSGNSFSSVGGANERKNSSTPLIVRRTKGIRGQQKDGDKTLTILGLFELTQNNLPRERGTSERVAAEMAIEDINAKGILQGYRLTMHTNDTQCDPGTGVDAFFHALYAKTDSKIVSLLGTACSEVTERLAKVATHKHIIQVSFGSTSPSLSDKKEFPLFYRTVAPVSSHSEAIIELIRHFQWDTVTFFTKNENRYTMPANFLVSELEKTNVTCKATLTFSISDYRDQLQDMKELDSRIIIANFGSDVAPQVFCEIYRMGMYGSDYAWILIGEPDTAWWQEYSTSGFWNGGRSSRSSKGKKGRKRTKRTLQSSDLVPRTSSFESDAGDASSKPATPKQRQIHLDDSGLFLSESLLFGDQDFEASGLNVHSRTDDDSISISQGIDLKAFGSNRLRRKSESGGGESTVGGFNRKDWNPRSGNGDPSARNISNAIKSPHPSPNPAEILKANSSDFFFNQYHREAHQTECNYKNFKEVLEHTIVVDRYNILEEQSASGMNTATFLERLVQRLKKTYVSIGVSPYAPETYDAVVSVALGLQKIQEKYNYLDEFTRPNEKFSNLMRSEIGELNFTGISGPITFSGSDRIGITSFMQIQDGELVRVGLFFPDRHTKKLELTCKGCRKIRWHGNQVPISRREFLFKLIRVEYWPYIIMATAASLGIILAATFLAFNLYNRKLKYIKLSSPKLNNIVIIGCMIAYLAVILLGTDFTTVPDGKQFAYICTIRAYLLSMAFSLAFGAMFAKTYRVYRIFTRSCIGVVKNKLLRDTQLMTLIMVLVLIDCIIVSSWAIFDPMHVNLRNLTLQIDPSDRTVVYQPQIEVCRSQHAHVWLSALYGYKSLLLVVGLYMAWETRLVKVAALNDSKYIGLCVYIVVLTSVLAVSLANLISERVTISFVSVTSLILFSTTVTLCLLFLPKIHAITKCQASTNDPIVESMGLKIECNTRRFIVEDTKELLFRAEVQNRVYKRQIDAIDAEIWRLENLLSCSPSKHELSGVDGATSCSCSADATTSETNVKGKNKKDRRKLSGVPDAGGEALVPEGDDSSSDENDSTSEIYTVYLHGPKFIVPISLYNFRNTAIPNSLTSPSILESAQQHSSKESGSLSLSPNTAPRSSWPNSRYLAPPTNGLVAKKYRFKSEPRLEVEVDHGSSLPSAGQSKNAPGNMPATNSNDNSNDLSSVAIISPPTIIQWGDECNCCDDADIIGISGVSSAGSSNASCNITSRKNSGTSATGSKRSSSIFSAFKSYFMAKMKQPGNTQEDSDSSTNGGVGARRRDMSLTGNYYYEGAAGCNSQTDNYLLKPTSYFGGQSKSSSQRQKFSSVPDLWAVRNSPDLEINHKKYSINSDTAAVGISQINSSRSHEIELDHPDPVLKLIVTSHESVYL